MSKAKTLRLPVILITAALAISPTLAAQDYPPGLFENSPVVKPGSADATAPGEPSEPEVPGEQPDAEAPLPPDMGGPPNAMAPLPPYAAGQPGDYCASMASRVFHSLEEVRRAHARCDPH